MAADNAPTVAELLFGGPLSGAWVSPDADLERTVREVRIIDEPDQLARLAPGTAVVLTANAARGEWGVETALRRSWERAAACVISPAAAVRTPAPSLIASRLKTPLITVTEDHYAVALALARSVGTPSIARADVIARCAAALAELRAPTPRTVLETLEVTVPGTQFAMLSRHHGLVAGPTAVLRAVQASDADPDHPLGQRVVCRSLPYATQADMFVAALLSARSVGLAGTVRVALGIAVPLLATAMLEERLAAERDAKIATGVLHHLLARTARPADDTDDEVLIRAGAYGWPLCPPVLPLAVVIADSTSPAELAAVVPAAWLSAGGAPILARYRTAWVTWQTCGDDSGTGPAVAREGDGEPEGDADAVNGPSTRRAVERLAAVLAEVHPVARLVGGVGPVVRDLAELENGLAAAVRAAQFARHREPGHVEVATAIGPDALLAALPADTLTGVARQALATLLDQDRDGSLLRTLAGLLDTGGATALVAARLGVHRNTITGRAQRLRSLGLDPDDLPDRLAIHLACHLLLHAEPQR